MDYLDYLQQYREKYHLDDIFNHNNNADVEQVEKYIGELCGVSYVLLELFCGARSEEHYKGGRTFPSNIHRFVMKNSVLENTGKEPKNIDYLTRMLVTTLGNPDSEILDSIARENNPVINKIISRHQNTSSDTLMYLASSNIYASSIICHSNITSDVLLEITKVLLSDLSKKIFWVQYPECDDWDFVQKLPYVSGKPSGRILDFLEYIVGSSNFNEDTMKLFLSVDDETMKTLVWDQIFYSMGRNPYISPQIMDILCGDQFVTLKYNGVLENPNAPKHILEKYSTHNKMFYRERVAYNTNTLTKTLERLANDNHPDVRCGVACNLNTSPETLELLANDDNRWVRLRVAKNPNTPTEILDRLANDKSWGTLEEVAHNRNASVKTLQNIINNLETFERKGDSSDWLIGHLKDFCTQRSLFLTSNS
jgi:hypothetical protein